MADYQIIPFFVFFSGENLRTDTWGCLKKMLFLKNMLSNKRIRSKSWPPNLSVLCRTKRGWKLVEATLPISEATIVTSKQKNWLRTNNKEFVNWSGSTLNSKINWWWQKIKLCPSISNRQIQEGKDTYVDNIVCKCQNGAYYLCIWVCTMYAGLWKNVGM